MYSSTSTPLAKVCAGSLWLWDNESHTHSIYAALVRVLHLHTGSLLGQSCFGDFGNEKDSVIFSQMRAPISIEALDSLD